jgi:HPt (histidine-containing phosphotransfer) domain-containing protein
MTMEQSLEGMFKLLAMLPEHARDPMVRMYGEALQSTLVVLAQALERREAQAALPVAHKIAGSAGMMQDQALSHAARRVEAELREGRAEAALQHWPELQLRAALTLECLRQAYPGLS